MWFLLGLVFSLHATNKFSYPPQAFPVEGVNQIRVEGVRGAVNFKEVPGRVFRVKVKHDKTDHSDDWHLVVERRQEVLHVEVFNVLFGADWESHVKKELWPEFDLEIEGPARPVILSWRDGQLQFNDWKAPVEASLLYGSVRVQGGGTRIHLQAVNADVQIMNYKGAIGLQGQRGPVRIFDCKGDIQLNWLSGKLELRKLDAKVHLESLSGHVRIAAAKGDWKVQNGAGQVEVSDFEGVLRAKGDSSLWKIAAGGSADLEVITQSGPVDVRWLAGGAKLFLTSNQGQIRVPRSLKIEDREGVPVVEGKKGRKPRGQLFVRTSSGSISFR